MEVVQSCFGPRNVLNFSFDNCRGCSMLVHIPGSETRLHNLNWTLTTMKTNLFDLPSTEIGVHEHAQPLQLWKLGFKILVRKNACTNPTMVGVWLHVWQLLFMLLFIMFLVVKHRYTPAHRTTMTVKTTRFPAMEDESTSIAACTVVKMEF